MTFFRQQLGKKGEDLAVEHLQKYGYKIIARNYKNKIGELDIIASQKKTLVFVEVKTKTEDEFGNPLEMIDWKKQRKLIKCIQYYLLQNKIDPSDAEINLRIDAISVEMDYQGNLIDLEHIENAVEVE